MDIVMVTVIVIVIVTFKIQACFVFGELKPVTPLSLNLIILNIERISGLASVGKLIGQASKVFTFQYM